MKKLKLLFVISIILLLLFLLTIISRAEQIKKETAKIKLERVIDQIPLEEKPTDVAIVKNKIKTDITNSKILNENSTQYPVYTKVDGYNFKVEENGTVESTNISNIITSDETTTNTIDTIIENNTINNAINETNNLNAFNEVTVPDKEIMEKSESTQPINLLKLQNDSITFKGLEVTTKEDGTITLNGSPTDKSFIKITNGISATTDGNKNIELINQENVLFEKGSFLHLTVEEVSGLCTTTNFEQQFNVVLKYPSGNFAANCKTRDNILSQKVKLEENITMVYLYVSPKVSFENYIVKPSIYSLDNLQKDESQ